MHILYFFLVFFLSLLSSLITSSLSPSIIFILLFFIGRESVSYFQEKKFRKNALLIFEITYIMFFIYALVCFNFMTTHGYDHLQSFDGINVYIPYTQELLNTNSLHDLIDKIYSTSKYSFIGSILIPFVYIGKLSSLIDSEFYLTIQLVIMLFASWTAVVIYNILLLNNISNKQALIYTLLYSIFSIHFYMSTYIVRDMPISFFFTLLIYFSFKSFTLKRLGIMILFVVLIASIRLSSGLFSLLYIFLVLFLSLKEGNGLKKIIVFSFFTSALFLLIFYIDLIKATFELKQLQYKAIEAAAGTSTVASFNLLPPGLSHIVKAMYNQFMPIPSWRTMVETTFRPESYNIMNFPIISATLFRYCMWFIILIGFSSKRIRTLIMSNKIVLYNILIALLFIAIQSDTMGHRRLLGVYPVFFLLSILIYQYLNNKNKKYILLMACGVFTLLQTVGLFSKL